MATFIAIMSFLLPPVFLANKVILDTLPCPYFGCVPFAGTGNVFGGLNGGNAISSCNIATKATPTDYSICREPELCALPASVISEVASKAFNWAPLEVTCSNKN